MAARKGDLVLYSGDLFPLTLKGTQTPIVSQITFRESKGEAYSSISSSRRSVRFYEASKHSSLTLINQEGCRHSLRLPLREIGEVPEELMPFSFNWDSRLLRVFGLYSQAPLVIGCGRQTSFTLLFSPVQKGWGSSSDIREITSPLRQSISSMGIFQSVFFEATKRSLAFISSKTKCFFWDKSKKGPPSKPNRQGQNPNPRAAHF